MDTLLFFHVECVLALSFDFGYCLVSPRQLQLLAVTKVLFVFLFSSSVLPSLPSLLLIYIFFCFS
jgi:hypothetical protein